MNRSPDAKLLDALAGMDVEADMAVVQRTRRAVMEAANHMREAHRRGRYQVGLALLTMAALLMFLTPTLWMVAEDVFNGERWLDAPEVAALLVVTTVSTIFATVVAQWNGRSRDESV